MYSDIDTTKNINFNIGDLIIYQASRLKLLGIILEKRNIGEKSSLIIYNQVGRKYLTNGYGVYMLETKETLILNDSEIRKA